jgi:hypothetical protein
MIARLRGPVGSSVQLQLQRKDRSAPLDVMVARGPNNAVLEVRTKEGKLVIEAVGRRPLFEFEIGKPIAVVPLSDSEFYVDGRYHTQIMFTKDASGQVTNAVLNPGLWEQKGVRSD